MAETQAMKIGEALTLRARLSQRLSDLQGRIKASAIVQEGDEAPESVGALIDEYLSVSEEHADLVRRIQHANATLALDDGRTLLDLLRERSVLVRKRNILRIAAQAASPTGDRWRYGRSEIKYVPKLDVAETHDLADKTEEEIRKIDAALQAANWQYTLPE